MSFEKELRAFEAKASGNFVKLLRSASFDLFSSIVMETPVDKGVLRNNWFASIGKASGSKTTRADAGGTGTINKIESVLKGASVAQDIYFTNNLPYAARIEFDGWSDKAPAGMVRINVLRWQRIVKANLRTLSRAG